MFAWLLIFRGLPSKARLAQSGLSDGLFPFCKNPENCEAHYVGMHLCKELLGTSAVSVRKPFVRGLCMGGWLYLEMLDQ